MPVIDPIVGINVTESSNFDLDSELVDLDKFYGKQDSVSTPPKDQVNVLRNFGNSLKFGKPIDFNPDIDVSIDARLKLKASILLDKCYFDPKYYNFDFRSRKIYTVDNSISIVLDFDTRKVDVRYLYFIISCIQLNVLELIDSNELHDIISLVCNILTLKYELKYRNVILTITRLAMGREVEKVILTLTSEEFTKEVKNQVIKADLRIRGNKFIPTKNIDSS